MQSKIISENTVELQSGAICYWNSRAARDLRWIM